MSRGITFIYTLNDPDTGKIRYVGKADDPLKRFKGHLRDRIPSHRTNWIKSLISAGKRPILEILDEVPKTEWEFWEKEYIRVFKMLGMNLINSTEGGEGMYPTPETREKMRQSSIGRSVPNERRERIRKNLTGRKTTRNTSGVVGVSRVGKYWQAAITVNRKTKSVGYFLDFHAAVEARERALQNIGG